MDIQSLIEKFNIFCDSKLKQICNSQGDQFWLGEIELYPYCLATFFDILNLILNFLVILSCNTKLYEPLICNFLHDFCNTTWLARKSQHSNSIPANLLNPIIYDIDFLCALNLISTIYFWWIEVLQINENFIMRLGFESVL